MPGREGLYLWNELISRHSNIFLSLCGHSPGSAYNVRKGNNGNTVYEILTDFQSEPVKGTGKAFGNGWLKLLQFYPSLGKIIVKSVSAEKGNTSIFPGGIPALYVPGSYNNGLYKNSKYKNLNHSFYYSMSGAVSNSYRINTYLYKDRTVNRTGKGQQRRPSSNTNYFGDTVVTWEDDRNENGYYEIMARTFDNNGNALSGDIKVNSNSNGQQYYPVTAIDAFGNYVVVWQDDKNKNGYYQIMVRGFYASGNQRFYDKTVNSDPSGQQLYPSISIDRYNRFVTTWQDDMDQNGYYQILARNLQM